MTGAGMTPSAATLVQEVFHHDDTVVERRLDRANVAYDEWRTTALSERARRMQDLARLLREELPVHAARITEEMGKPIAEAEKEIAKCARLAEHYAKEAPDLLATRDVLTSARSSYVRYDPLGPVLAIMPWNFPYWQIMRAAVPALMAGNVVVVKPAPITVGCAEALASTFAEAGFPNGVLSTLLIDEERVEDVIHDARIAAVTFTGSPEVGAEVAEAAAAVVKKVVLELGGSDPFIVLDDADLDAAVDVAVQARMQANGQSCIAAKRFLVESGVHDTFVEGLVARMEAIRSGDPRDPKTQLGPLARLDLRDRLHRQVIRSVRMGAEVRCGGVVPPGEGAHYPPTVLTEVTPGMPVFDQETFGPVAAVTRVADEDEAVRLANANRYGLGGTVFAGDPSRGERIAALLDVGQVAVNGLLKSDPRLPFGGVKASGHGRELGDLGLFEFVNAKSISVDPA